MKKLILIGILLLSIATVSASEQTRLAAVLSSYTVGSGTASLRVLHDLNTMSSVRVETYGLPYLGRGGMYELWLVDEQTGWKQSAGVFPSSLSGRTILTHTIQDDLSVFDLVMVTQEAFDGDPRPGKMVMIGALNPESRRSFNKFLPNPPNYRERSMGYYQYSLAKSITR